MNDNDYLHSATGWQKKIKTAHTRLGEEVASYLERRSRTFEKNAALAEVWQQVVPCGLQSFCRMDKRSGHTLYIQVRPGPYMHQMWMLSGELLEQINRQIPRSGIQAIRVIPLNEE
jgi:hypothetical protein